MSGEANGSRRRCLCIAGLGLIGGSLAAALKTRVPHRWQALGVDFLPVPVFMI